MIRLDISYQFVGKFLPEIAGKIGNVVRVIDDVFVEFEVFDGTEKVPYRVKVSNLIPVIPEG